MCPSHSAHWNLSNVAPMFKQGNGRNNWLINLILVMGKLVEMRMKEKITTVSPQRNKLHGFYNPISPILLGSINSHVD